MIKKEYDILNSIGLHARPAALFVQTANKFISDVMVEKNDSRINGKSIMGIMALCVSKGDKITVYIDGPDENIAMDAIQDLLTKKIIDL